MKKRFATGKTNRLFKIDNNDADVEAVASVIRSGHNWAKGEEISLFETEIEKYIGGEDDVKRRIQGKRYVSVLNSGTSALHALMLAYKFGPGDEIIVPKFTFKTTYNAPKFVGATPVFADVELETYGLRLASIKEKVTERTKAVILVHYAGCPAKETKEIVEFCEDHGIILIEDAAESFGASINKKMVGTFGDSAILSFCQSKTISTGEGGAVITRDKKVFDAVNRLRSHGNDDETIWGFNWRMPSMNAALGISQMRRIEEIIEKRRKNAKAITEGLKKAMEESRSTMELMCPSELILPKEPHGFRHVYNLYTIRFKTEIQRDKVLEMFETNGIGAKVYFEKDEKVGRYVLSIHPHTFMIQEDIDKIVGIIRRSFSR